MSKWQLAEALFARRTTATRLVFADGTTAMGIVFSVERESGDGKCFNVSYYDENNKKQLRYVRTTD